MKLLPGDRMQDSHSNTADLQPIRANGMDVSQAPENKLDRPSMVGATRGWELVTVVTALPEGA